MMSATAEMQLGTFNTLALHCQDDAYTLAYYLLADEARAAQATEAAFANLYRWPGLRPDQFRLEIFCRVLANSRKDTGPLSTGRQDDNLSRQLQQLMFEERAAAVLIDVMALSYEEAARVMNSSQKQVARLLAQARLAISQTASLLSPQA